LGSIPSLITDENRDVFEDNEVFLDNENKIHITYGNREFDVDEVSVIDIEGKTPEKIQEYIIEKQHLFLETAINRREADREIDHIMNTSSWSDTDISNIYKWYQENSATRPNKISRI
jgi:hypothetical protein